MARDIKTVDAPMAALNPDSLLASSLRTRYEQAERDAAAAMRARDGAALGRHLMLANALAGVLNVLK